eukprot:UN10936
MSPEYGTVSNEEHNDPAIDIRNQLGDKSDYMMPTRDGENAISTVPKHDWEQRSTPRCHDNTTIQVPKET